MGFEPPKYLLPFVGTVVRGRGQCFDRFDIAAQFVGDDDPWFAEVGHQSFEKSLCRFGITVRLHEDAKNVAICVDRAPQPMFPATDHDYDLVHVPLVAGSGTVLTDALREGLTKAADPKLDGLAAGNDTLLRQQIPCSWRSDPSAQERGLEPQRHPEPEYS